MRRLPFTKMHGAGNDFVLLDGLQNKLPPLEALAAQIADRHFGVGCDQLLVLRAASGDADFRMEIYNADGSQAEMCANGIRCLYKYLRDAGHTEADAVRIETLAGVVTPQYRGEGRVCVDMGAPVLAPAKIPTTLGDAGAAGPLLDAPIEVAGETLRVSCVAFGNPHCVSFVTGLDTFPVERIGAALENHPAFPNRTNVAFVEIVSRHRLRQRTFERGVGETLACGSAACAVAVVSVLRGVADTELVVALRGGELELAWPGGAGSVLLTGPAATVASGEVVVVK